MHSKKLISILAAALSLFAATSAYAGGATADAPGAKRVLKRLVPRPAPVLLVNYGFTSGSALGQHVYLEGSLLSIRNFVASAGPQSVKEPAGQMPGRERTSDLHAHALQ
jgi:hypothetical protein